MINNRSPNKWRYFDGHFEYEKAFADLDQPWAGHKYFIYDFVSNIKPKVIVELGAERGTSFFAMSQAVKDSKSGSKLFAIDTWKGDVHTGFYGEDVYRQFMKKRNKYFANLDISVLRMQFDKAVSKFKDGSIDLLHIDGLHTFEAVKHDYETWKRKVKPKGTILFHDIKEKSREIGVYKLWDKLKKTNNTIEFNHSHGLGVLIRDQKLFAKIKKLEPIWQRYYRTLFEYKKLSSFDYNDKKIEYLNNEIKKLDEEIENYRGILNNITSAKVFRIWQSYCRIRDKIFRR